MIVSKAQGCRQNSFGSTFLVLHGFRYKAECARLCAGLQVHVQGKALDIASVFYALALLHLPKLSMAQNFVHAVEAGSELKVSMQRINDFLSLPEPPAPAHLQGAADPSHV